MEKYFLSASCLIFLICILVSYLREIHYHKIKLTTSIFFIITVLSIISRINDMLCIYIVDNLTAVPDWMSYLFFVFYYVISQTIIYALYIYALIFTDMYPKEKRKRIIYWTPLFIANIFMMYACHRPEYHLVNGSPVYEIGMPTILRYTITFLCVILTLITFRRGFHYIDRHKASSIKLYLMVMIIASTIQLFLKKVDITCIGTTIIVFGLYTNEDNPALWELANFHKRLTAAFANLVEDRDSNTGGHVKRVTAYVEILTEYLLQNRIFKELNYDYLKSVCKAAPLHDVGKIAIPDAILCKEGKLTDEEYVIMKTHAPKGGEIIRKSLARPEDGYFNDIAFEVATYHHEKWNGRGYPKGLSGRDIPLCARIMAVADVFDAISQDRCYRPAMPMNQCFKIIAEGSGQDFDPEIVDAFMKLRPEIEDICLDFRKYGRTL